MDTRLILEKLPYKAPFLFVDGLDRVDEMGVVGTFTFKEELDFYRGHIKGYPITPGVILTECCAQIGLVCLGIFLIGQDIERQNLKMGLSSSQMEFYKPVFPGEKVFVTSKKIYFRFNKLKCEVSMHNAEGDLICKGILAGMIKTETDG